MSLHSYAIKVVDSSEIAFEAVLEPATAEDMPINWTCNWVNFWNRADFDCEAIIRLSCQGRLLGLIRFALYPYTETGLASAIECVEILHLETLPRRDRNVHPVGFWLIWYAVRIALDFCVGEADGTLVKLDAIKAAIPYYRDKVMMEGLGWTTIAPREDGYAFRFTEQGATAFLNRQQNTYGIPRRFA
jgi:hypothetical protein